MEGESLHYSLRCFAIYLLMTGVFSLDSLSPGPLLYVINGSNVTFTCSAQTIWEFANFYDRGIKEDNLARVIFRRNSTHCWLFYKAPDIGDDKYSALPCNISQPVSIIVRYINESYNNKSIGCKFDARNTSVTTVFIREQLTTVDLNPKGVVTIKENITSTFTCKAESIPKSTIGWYLEGRKLTDPVETTNATKNTIISEITYLAKKEHNSRNLYCSANDTFKSLNSSFVKLDINYSPLTPTITQSPTAPVNESTVIIFTCEIIGGNPLANITWQCNGASPVNSTGPVSDYKSISQVRLEATEANNGKLCICTGLHPAWTNTNSTSLKLDIRYPPAKPLITQKPSGSIIEGSKVVLTCSIYGGNPLATITWKCDGFTYTTQTSSPVSETVVSSIELNITKENDGKECICRGKHLLWTNDEKKKHLFDVYYSPSKYPLIAQTPSGSVDEGTRITLTCEIPGGKPLAVITWQCEGSSPSTPTSSPPTNTSISSVDLIVTKNQNDEECICLGSHPAWKQNHTFIIKLDVRYPPELFSPITQTPSGPVIEDNTVILKCEIDGGNPLANMSWHCDGFTSVSSIGNTIGNKTVSIIEKNVSKEDNGKNCSCIGHHNLWLTEKQTRSKTLNVYYSSTIQIVNVQPIILIENKTLVLACTETDGNPRNASFMWYKSNSIIESGSNYSIKNAKAKDAGNYTCHGSNGFGRRSEAVVQVDVLYSPRVSALSAPYGSTVAENDNTVLQCTVQSNPPPTMEWMKHGSNTILHGNRNLFQSNLTIERSSCFDTGNYTCKAKNIINRDEYTAMKDIELFVNCSPRLYDQQEGSTHSLGLAVGQDLTIREHILSYPIGDITWYFKKDKNTSEVILKSVSDCGIYNIFDHQICFSRLNLTENDFGLYSAFVVNDIGNATFTYTVDPQGKPYQSTNVNVTCGTLNVEVSWITGFNGGQVQTFYIIATDKDGLQLLKGTGLVGNHKGEAQRYSVTMSAGLYNFDVFGNNTFGNATVKGASCEVQGLTDMDSIIGLAVGLGFGIASMLIIIVAVFYFCRKRASKKNDDDATLFKGSQKKINEEDDDGDDNLKDNPLYVSSDTKSCGENGPVYSTVKKTKMTGVKKPVNFQVSIQGPVYSEVKKAPKKDSTEDKTDGNEKKMKKKEKKGKDNRVIEMGNIYGNAEKIHQNSTDDDVYANTKSNMDRKNDKSKMYSPKKNKDGLIYADLELDPSPSGKKFVIRGLENRTNYAVIDLNLKVDPIPSDDDEEDQEQKTDKDLKSQDGVE